MLRNQSSEHGATAVEYALIVGLIAVAIIGAVALLGNKVVDTTTSTTELVSTTTG